MKRKVTWWHHQGLPTFFFRSFIFYYTIKDRRTQVNDRKVFMILAPWKPPTCLSFFLHWRLVLVVRRPFDNGNLRHGIKLLWQTCASNRQTIVNYVLCFNYGYLFWVVKGIAQESSHSLLPTHKVRGKVIFLICLFVHKVGVTPASGPISLPGVGGTPVSGPSNIPSGVGEEEGVSLK